MIKKGSECQAEHHVPTHMKAVELDWSGRPEPTVDSIPHVLSWFGWYSCCVIAWCVVLCGERTKESNGPSARCQGVSGPKRWGSASGARVLPAFCSVLWPEALHPSSRLHSHTHTHTHTLSHSHTYTFTLSLCLIQSSVSHIKLTFFNFIAVLLLSNQIATILHA
ncbi:hypothetical protein E2P81_ATG00183 [Venturia nashicola]|nr:hypothetical protein E2P81_ATG00183 [Venturia nashicola]